ncbi:MAG: 4Fe-4S dicluster domain-containing protein, partial [archaeon]|nr:4Fe-4S dicluster domain-containing protein [archaeon]
ERMQGTKGGELYQKFFIEEKFYKRYESSDKGTAWNRVLPIGKTIAKKDQIINIEELHQVLEDNMKPIVATDCPCRKRTEILGIREQACKDKNPIEGCCLQLGAFGTYFLKRGEGRELSLDEAHELVDNLGKKGLVFITDNAKAPAHQIICACCECCCAMLRGMTRFPDKNEAAVNKSNYIAEVNPDLCKGCGLCEKRCPFNAITLDSNKKSHVEPDKCFGCGVCAFTCPTDAVKLHRHERSEIMETSPQLLMKIYKENREP